MKKLDEILVEVSHETGVTVEQLKSQSKRALFIRARSFFAHAAQAEGYNLNDIAYALNRQHPAVINYLTKKGVKKDMAQKKWSPEDVEKKVESLTAQERRVLVEVLARKAQSKEERSEARRFFSDADGEPSPAPVEAAPAGGTGGAEVVPSPKPKKGFSELFD